MAADDLLVEVRNASLEKVGVITALDLKLAANIPFNAVGSWTLTLAKAHPLTSVLSSPGGGIVVSDLTTNKVLFSGPATAPEEAWSFEEQGGNVVINGITDEIVLEDRLAFPVPTSANLDDQEGSTYDTRTGQAETLMHQYVSANIGPDGASARRHPSLGMGTDRARGGVVTHKARFENLLTTCQALAAPDVLGFRVVQYGTQLRFETYAPVDNRANVQLTFDTDTLVSSRFAQSAPGTTRAIVVGNGGAGTKFYIERSNAKSLEAEQSWGRRIEKFVDASSSAATAALQRAGDELLATDGYTGISATFEPGERFRGGYGKDWMLGDLVSVLMGNTLYDAPVSALIVKADSEGLRIGAELGDVTSWDQVRTLHTQIDKARKIPSELMRTEVETTPKIYVAQATAEAAAVTAEAAAEAATTAQESADGKNTVWHGPTAPAGSAHAVDDTWFETDNGNKIHKWDGDSWEPVELGTNAIANLSITNGLIANGTIQNAKIGSLDAGKITTGELGADRIAANAITSKHTITGPLFQTSASANRGIKIASSLEGGFGRLTTYDATGAETFVLNGQTGSVTMKGELLSGSTVSGATITGGTIRTAATGRRIVIAPEEFVTPIKFYSGDTDEVSAGMLYAPTDPGYPMLALQGPATNTRPQAAYIGMVPATEDLLSTGYDRPRVEISDVLQTHLLKVTQIRSDRNLVTAHNLVSGDWTRIPLDGTAQNVPNIPWDGRNAFRHWTNLVGKALVRVELQVRFAANATGRRAIRIVRGTNAMAAHASGSIGNVVMDMNMSTEIVVNYDQTVSVEALQSSGAGLDLINGPDLTYATFRIIHLLN